MNVYPVPHSACGFNRVEAVASSRQQLTLQTGNKPAYKKPAKKDNSQNYCNINESQLGPAIFSSVRNENDYDLMLDGCGCESRSHSSVSMQASSTAIEENSQNPRKYEVEREPSYTADL